MNFTHLAANGAATIGSSGIGIKVHTVCINTKGAAANTLTLAQGATTIAVIDTVNLATNVLIYDVDTTGPVTATLATGTAADITITWQ